MTDHLRSYKVVLDGGVVGALRPGDSLTCEVAPGAHEVFLKIVWARNEKFDRDHQLGRAKPMAKYEVGFDGRWQETFEDRDQAIQWAEEVAETGRVVDVVLKRRFLPRKFLTAFPESEREARAAAWFMPWTGGGYIG